MKNLRRWIGCVLVFLTHVVFACDGTDVTVTSTVDNGDGTYTITFNVCYEPGDFTGNTDQLTIQFNGGGATIVNGQYTPVITFSDGTEFNASLNNSTTVQWEVDGFDWVGSGEPDQCHEVWITTNGLPTGYDANVGPNCMHDEVGSPIPDPCTAPSPAWTNPGPLCVSDASINLNDFITGDTGGTWEVDGVGSSNTFNPATNGAGSYTITYNVGTGSCTASQDQTVVVDADVDASTNTIGPFCDTEGSVSLNTYVTGDAGGSWTINGSNASSFDPSAFGTGSYTLAYTVTNGACSATSSQTVTVNSSEDASWTNPGPMCASEAAVNLNTYVTGDAGGTWTVDGVAASNMFDPSAMGPGNYDVAYTTGGTCPATSNLTVVVTNAADASWTNPGPLCENSVAIDLDTYVTGDAGGNWEVDGVAASNTFDPNALGSGTYNVVYEVGSGACMSTQSYNIIVNALGDPTWSTPGSMCPSDAAVDLNTYVTGDAGGTWTVDGVASSNTFDPGSYGEGSYSVEYTVGTCPQSLDLVITVTSSADASWTDPGAQCTTDAVIDLNTLVTGDAGGTWEVDGVIASSTFDPSALGAGVYIVNYSLGNGACAASQAYNITVNDAGDPSWTNPGDFCTTDGAIDLDAYVTGSTGGAWTVNGIASGNSFDPSALGAGSYIIDYTLTSGSCVANESYTITVNQGGDASWTGPGSLCTADAAIDLNSYVTGDAGGTWEVDGVGSTNIFDPSTYGNGSYTVTYIAGAGNCTSVVDQTITINDVMDASWTNPLELCVIADDLDLNSTITGNTGGTWTINGNANNNFDPAVLGVGTHSVTYSVGTGGCSDTETASINVVDTPDPSWTTTSLCENDAILDLSTLIDGQTGGTWSGLGVTGNDFDASVSGTGTINVTYTVGDPGCQSDSSQFITVFSVPTSTFSVEDICEEENLTSSYTGNGSVSATYDWDFDGLTAYGAQWGTQDLGFPDPGNYDFSLTVTENGCVSSTTVITVNVYELPQFTGIVTDVSCNGDCDGIILLTNANVAPSTYIFTWSNDETTQNINGLCPGEYDVFIRSAETCINTFSFTVEEPEAIEGEITPQDISCFGANDGLVTATGSGGTGTFTYAWDNGETGDQITGLSSGAYSVDITDENGCVLTLDTMVFEPDSLLAGYNVLHEGTQEIAFDNTFFLNLPSDFETYEWAIDDSLSGTEEQFTNAFQNTGTYNISITVYEGGCSETIDTEIEITQNIQVFVPSAFSPNGSDDNEIFIPQFNYDNLAEYEFTVYNRWGEQLFQAQDPLLGWDGTANSGNDIVQMDVYVYKLFILDTDGNQIEKMGHVTLIK